MSTTEALIAQETGRMSIDEKKASVPDHRASISSSTSSSSSSSSSSCSHLSNKPCYCMQMKNHPCCNQMFQGCQFPPHPCMMSPWGLFYVPPPCYYNPCLAKRATCCQATPKKCPSKICAKKSKSRKEEPQEPADTKPDEKTCKCCQEGKCECCKTGKECGKDDDNASVKSDKSDKSEKSGKDDAGSGGEEEDE